jgi:hypothetical protein
MEVPFATNIGMAMVNQPTPPPGASVEGVGRLRSARVFFNLADRPIKKLISKLNYYFSLYNPPNSIAVGDVHTMY